MNKNFKVDNEKCTKCGLCIKDCVTGAIEQNENNTPVMKNPLKCIECQHCLAICPLGALSIKEKNPDDSDAIRKINDEDLFNLIASRRSVRQYKKMNVSKDTIAKVKKMLNYVPTGCNSHKLHFSFIEDIEVMDDFRNKVNSKLISVLSKKQFKFLADKLNKFTKEKDGLFKGEDVIFRDAPHLVVVSAPIDSPCPNQDGIIALSYFELYAQSLGLGTLWCGFAQYILKTFVEFCEYLQIPQGYTPVYVMLFGYSDIKYQRTIQPDKYSFLTIEKQDLKVDFLEKVKRFFWNLR